MKHDERPNFGASASLLEGGHHSVQEGGGKRRFRVMGRKNPTHGPPRGGTEKGPWPFQG